VNTKSSDDGKTLCVWIPIAGVGSVGGTVILLSINTLNLSLLSMLSWSYTVLAATAPPAVVVLQTSCHVGCNPLLALSCTTSIRRCSVAASVPAGANTMVAVMYSDLQLTFLPIRLNSPAPDVIPLRRRGSDGPPTLKAVGGIS